MIANLTRGAKTASLHLPADRFQIAGVLSYLGVDRLDDYELPCEGQDSSGTAARFRQRFSSPARSSGYSRAWHSVSACSP